MNNLSSLPLFSVSELLWLDQDQRGKKGGSVEVCIGLGQNMRNQCVVAIFEEFQREAIAFFAQKHLEKGLMYGWD